MRYRRYKAAGESFSAKVKNNEVIVSCYNSNKKYAEYKIDIEEYLNRETAYRRRLYIIEMDINGVKTEMLQVPIYVIDGNIDCIQKAIDAALKDVGLYKLTAAEKLEEYLKLRSS